MKTDRANEASLRRRVLYLNLDGQTVPITLTRRVQAKRYILRVHPSLQDIQLTVPAHGSVQQARMFLNLHRKWLRERVSALPQPHCFAHNALFPFKGKMHRISHLAPEQNPHSSSSVWIQPTTATEDPHEFPRIYVATRNPYRALRIHLRDWLKQQARQALESSAQQYAQKLGVQFSSLSLRDQKSRWGSCSIKGGLSFSWRLIMAPHYVLDYLAAHEVTHLRFMNHSKAYWDTLYALCAHTEKAEYWLENNGHELHRYDSASEKDRPPLPAPLSLPVTLTLLEKETGEIRKAG